MSNFSIHDNEAKFATDFGPADLILKEKASIIVKVFVKLEVPINEIELPVNHRERTRGEYIRQEIENIKNGRVRPVVVYKTTNPEQPYRLLVGDNRYDAHKVLGKETIPIVLENRLSEDKDITDFYTE